MVHVVFHVDNRDVCGLGESTHVLVPQAVLPAHCVAIDADGDRFTEASKHLGHVIEPLSDVSLLETLDRRCVDRV